jgi:hypothetical protein
MTAPAVAVIVFEVLFEVLLNATSQFNHANLRLPKALTGDAERMAIGPNRAKVLAAIERNRHRRCLSAALIRSAKAQTRISALF